MVDTRIPASFIPRDTSAPPSARRHVAGLYDLLFLCSIVLLVASIALAIGVFLYGQYLTAESGAKLAQLERAKAAFQPALIQQFIRLDDRIRTAEKILNAHIAPSLFFHALEQTTLQTVSFKTLDFQITDTQNLSIKMTGVARSVNSIALQADLFSKNGMIASPIFSNIARQPDGVHFNLSATVNPLAINYAKNNPGLPGSTTGNPALPTENVPPPSPPSPFDAPPEGEATDAAGANN